MSNVNKVLEKNIETLETLEKEYEKKAGPRMKYVSVRSALNNAVISLKKTRDRYSEELVKEPQRICKHKREDEVCIKGVSSSGICSGHCSHFESQECNSDCISRKKLLEDIRKNGAIADFMKEYLEGLVNNQPQAQPIARSTEETKQKLMEYFTIGDSSAYYLTRVKEAFSIGTMTLDDFVEFTENDIDDLIYCLTKKEV